MQFRKSLMLGATVAGLLTTGYAVAQEQYIGLPSYRVGAYAAGGTALYGGWIDYMQMLNQRDGGVNGVKLTWEECETEYNNARGVECYERMKNRGPTGNTVFQPLSICTASGLSPFLTAWTKTHELSTPPEIPMMQS